MKIAKWTKKQTFVNVQIALTSFLSWRAKVKILKNGIPVGEKPPSVSASCNTPPKKINFRWPMLFQNGHQGQGRGGLSQKSFLLPSSAPTIAPHSPQCPQPPANTVIPPFAATPPFCPPSGIPPHCMPPLGMLQHPVPCAATLPFNNCSPVPFNHHWKKKQRIANRKKKENAVEEENVVHHV